MTKKILMGATALLTRIVLLTSTGNALKDYKILQHRHRSSLELPHATDADRNLLETDDIEQQVEQVFRRLQMGSAGNNRGGGGSSFLDNQLYNVGGGGPSATTTATGYTPLQNEYYYAASHSDFAVPQSHGKPPKGSKGGTDNKYYHQDDTYQGNGGKGAKSGKVEKEKKHKKVKKTKEEGKDIHKKLAKDGYHEEVLYDDYDYDEETYGDYWHYNDWAWEYDEEWVEEEDYYHQQASSSWYYDEEHSYRPGSGGMGSNHTLDNDEANILVPTGRMGDGVESQAHTMDGWSNVQRTKPLQKQTQEFLPQMDYQGSPTFKFNFPTVQHRVYSGPVLLKAHSPFDLSEMDPEIFAVLQSVLTPYLQTEVGSNLRAYTLEVDYSSGNDEVSDGIVVTNLQVTCALKVVSDSIKSLTDIDHTHASQWIHDFFAGPEMNDFLTALRSNNINVNEIVFVNQEFKNPLNNGVIASVNGGGRPTATTASSESGGGHSGAVIGVTIAIVAVGVIMFLHITGRLPSRERINELTLSIRDSFSSGSQSHSDDDLNYALEDIHNIEEGGRKQRNRTWSGTFRRFPTGGIRPAAIQKQPARSQDYLGDSSSKGTSSSEGKTSKNSLTKEVKSTNGSSTVHDDYSFSVGGDYNVGGDYGSTSPRTPSHRNNPFPITGETPSRHDEFSMPEEYDTVSEDHASLYSKWSMSMSVMNPLGRRPPPPTQPNFGMSPLPSPRRIMPSDINSSPQNAAGIMDAWSMASFDVKSPSERQLYRDFNGSSMSPESSSSPRSKAGLNIPRFT